MPYRAFGTGFRFGQPIGSVGYNPPKLTIIIPVRREEETIERTITLLEKAVKIPHLIIIADDTVDPSDKTINIVKKMKSHFIIISQKQKNDADGFGPALVRAAKKVKTPYTVFVMADRSDDPKTIDRMVDVIKQDRADVVVGCRYRNGGKKMGGPMLQNMLSTGLNWFLFPFFTFRPAMPQTRLSCIELHFYKIFSRKTQRRVWSSHSSLLFVQRKKRRDVLIFRLSGGERKRPVKNAAVFPGT